MNTIALQVRGLGQAFGAKRILHDVNLSVPRGQFVALVGPSGCGKSTLLKAIVGTHVTQRGEVRHYKSDGHPAGERVTGPGRERGIVYQHYSLFPFLTAQENVAIGLTLDTTTIPGRLFRPFKWRKTKQDHLDRAAEMLRRVGLAESLRLYPHELSGGMRQRVALAQAMVMEPEMILLDEPFGALDEATREDLQRMLLQLNAETRATDQRNGRPPLTLIIVTHELNEALYVGDRVIGLSQHWDWAGAGHREFPGATVVYDQPAPTGMAKFNRDFELFRSQRDNIRRTVFGGGSQPRPFSHTAAFLTAGRGSGAVPQGTL